MKLRCLGQKPPRSGPVTVQEMAFRRVQKGEIIELDTVAGNMVLDRYRGRFVVVEEVKPLPEPEPVPVVEEEKQAQRPRNKMHKKTDRRDKESDVLADLM